MNCLQDIEGDFYNPDKRDNICSEETVGRHCKARSVNTIGSISIT